jgi:anti-anti-sigma factor
VEEALFIKETNNRIYIRAQGHVSANSCTEIKARVFDRLEAKPAVEDVYMDMTNCEYMDSTFMGLIVGFNKRFLRFSDHPITLIGLNETCLKLLKTIGVARLINIVDTGVPFPEPLEQLGAGKKARAGFILRAHEELMELSEENEQRFSSLRSILRDAAEKEDTKE